MYHNKFLFSFVYYHDSTFIYSKDQHSEETSVTTLEYCETSFFRYFNYCVQFLEPRNEESKKRPPDYTKGVFQTLGFKEFHEYLMLSEEKRNSDEGRKLLQQSIENMKMATRRYARRQNKMVKGRFLDIPTREVPPIYELNTTDLSKWNDEVKNKAIEIIESYINNVPCNYEPLKKNLDEEKSKIDGHSCNYCEVCERLIIGDKEFSIHLNSHKHKRVLKKKKKLLAQKEKEEKQENDFGQT